MPLTLVPNPGAANANTYASLAEADTYFAARPHAEDWTGAGVEPQSRALLWSTNLIDRLVKWFGWKSTDTQALAWPRSGVLDREGSLIEDTSVPSDIKQVTFELAVELLRKDRSREPAVLGLGLKEAKVGSITAKFDASQILPILPPIVSLLVEPYGTIIESSGMVVKLKRV